jgi:uncharacterized OB-fold protein
MSVHSFIEGLKKSKLLGCKCIECNRMMAPPRMVCTGCGSTNLEEYCFEGKGTIKTKTIIYVPLKKFRDLNPYTVGIVALNEGPNITGLILGENESIKIDDKVEVVCFDEGEGKVLAFKLLD